MSSIPSWLNTCHHVFFGGFKGVALHPPAKNNAGAPLVVAPVWVVQPDKAEVGHQPATEKKFRRDSETSPTSHP